MKLSEYQVVAERTSSHPHQVVTLGTGKMPDKSEFCTNNIRSPAGFSAAGERLLEAAMGLTGEAGEVGDYLKKIVFHGHPFDRTKLAEELGDTLWYLAEAASAAGLTLEDIAAANIDKLKKRYPDKFSAAQSIARKTG